MIKCVCVTTSPFSKFCVYYTHCCIHTHCMGTTLHSSITLTIQNTHKYLWYPYSWAVPPEISKDQDDYVKPNWCIPTHCLNTTLHIGFPSENIKGSGCWVQHFNGTIFVVPIHTLLSPYTFVFAKRSLVQI